MGQVGTVEDSVAVGRGALLLIYWVKGPPLNLVIDACGLSV